jgi:hypothetical protein
MRLTLAGLCASMAAAALRSLAMLRPLEVDDAGFRR